MISFEVPIYLDALSILNKKVDIRAEVENQLNQGDPALENILEELAENAAEDGLEPLEGTDPESVSVDELMAYVLPIDESKIEFDYGEAYASDNRRLAVFRIPCEFDDKRFLQDYYVKADQEIDK